MIGVDLKYFREVKRIAKKYDVPTTGVFDVFKKDNDRDAEAIIYVREGEIVDGYTIEGVKHMIWLWYPSYHPYEEVTIEEFETVIKLSTL